MICAYAAGFFDGEGSIAIRREGQRYRLEVTASNTAKDVLDQFAVAYNGKVRAIRCTQPHHKQVYQWRVYAKQAGDFLEDVLPYLVVKRERALLALRFRASHFGHAHGNAKAVAGTEIEAFRATCFTDMKALNARGRLVTN